MSGRQKSSNISLIVGGASAAIQAIVIFTSGSPYSVAHTVASLNFIPPVWIWCLTLIIDAFLLGYAFGNVFFELSSGKSHRESEVRAYQGGMFFTAACLLSFIHYPLFFIQQKFFMSLIISLLILCLSCLCIFFWRKVSFISCAAIFIHSSWTAYVFLANGYVVFTI